MSSYANEVDLDTFVDISMFLFYYEDGIRKVNVEKTDWGIIKARFFDDFSLRQMLSWVEYSFNHHTRAYYFKMSELNARGNIEYVFFIDVGPIERPRLPIDSDHDVTVEEFWIKGQRCQEYEFSISASQKMNMAYSLGILQAFELPPFHCDVVAQISTTEIAKKKRLCYTVSLPDPNYRYTWKTDMHDWENRRILVVNGHDSDDDDDDDEYTPEQLKIIQLANMMIYPYGPMRLEREGLPPSLWNPHQKK